MPIFALGMDIFGQTPTHLVLFFILYGVTGVVPFIAAVYLLLCRGNAFAPDITPPLRLRRWATAFFSVATLGHVWWLLFYLFSDDFHSKDNMLLSVNYVMVVWFDCVTLLTTIAGTLLSMLQDRRRPVWPVLVAMLPFVAIGGVLMVSPGKQLMQVAITYVLLLYILFTIYVAFAVRQYGRWLRDNFADLEHKEVWLSQMLMLTFMLLFILYALVDIESIMVYILHLIELMLFGLLLWRVETLPNLTPDSSPIGGESEPWTSQARDDSSQGEKQADEPSTPLHTREGQGGGPVINLAQIEQLLAEHCVATQLYLQHDLTLQQLAQAVGTNRSYLSQYFSRQGITYNTYINNLRINHFISRCHEAAADGQPFTVQQLASESGYRSYSTFSLAFKQRTGQSASAWIRETGEDTERGAT